MLSSGVINPYYPPSQAGKPCLAPGLLCLDNSERYSIHRTINYGQNVLYDTEELYPEL